jgi:hypothetical protein
MVSPRLSNTRIGFSDRRPQLELSCELGEALTSCFDRVVGFAGCDALAVANALPGSYRRRDLLAANRRNWRGFSSPLKLIAVSVRGSAAISTLGLRSQNSRSWHDFRLFELSCAPRFEVTQFRRV